MPPSLDVPPFGGGCKASQAVVVVVVVAVGCGELAATPALRCAALSCLLQQEYLHITAEPGKSYPTTPTSAQLPAASRSVCITFWLSGVRPSEGGAVHGLSNPISSQ